MANFRSFTLEDAVAAASAALSVASGGPVRIEAVESLGDDQRRNFVARGRAVHAGTAPRSIVLKATRAISYDQEAANAYETSGFVKEWAAAHCLAHHAPGASFIADLLAADLKQGVLVYSDLGAGLASLVAPLLHGTAQEAEGALSAYAEAMAALHRTTIGCRDVHARFLKEGYPSTAVPPPAHRWLENVARAPHALLGGDFPEDEVALIAERLKQPGAWAALVHGDPCPDNVLLAADGRAILIDFEFARPSHALLDAAYWRMGFPTCWCAGAVPAGVRDRIDRAYRNAVADAVPEAMAEDAFRRESAIIDVAWLFGQLAWLLKGALAADSVWGRATNRSRILTYLNQAILSAKEAGVLPRLCALAGNWRDELRDRWPATEPLSDFPAFAVLSDRRETWV